MGFNAIAAASESVFIPEDILRSLRYKWKYIVILYDRDKTGMLKARQYSKPVSYTHLDVYKRQ